MRSAVEIARQKPDGSGYIIPVVDAFELWWRVRRQSSGRHFLQIQQGLAGV
jgi:hypothetical protein